MRHQKAGKKLNRTASHRSAMFRNMVTSLFKHGQVRTTDAKAKELRRWADRMVTLAKRGDLHARRQALSVVREKAVVHKLFEQAAELYGGRPGGYTRIIKIGRRPGDAAPISLVQLVAPSEKKADKKKKTRSAKKGVDRAKKEAPVKSKEKEKSKEAKTAKKAAQKAAPDIEKEAISEPEGDKSSEEAEARSESTEAPETKADKEKE
ncbi:MAG: 50S ribosomal protein L17 [Deltaproteobacteria bacterium]|nr:50S ribosomal protein L17 [Deltaproteobacteria bacterium]MBW2074287.1 50S ribosomal protein L17 [Deltaproteobacteria bacterium]RLB81079.1 MAG: 50S ribosomal protein L17 [Deltaproteobacteria bacterium]